MLKVICSTLTMLLTASLLLGCGDFKDVDRRVFIVAIGIDGTEGGKKTMKVSLKAAMPISGGENGGAGGSGEKDIAEVYTVKGESLAQIFREVKSQTSMEPDFSHMKLIIFGTEFARSNSISQCIEFFTRRRDFQNIAYVSVGEPSAEEILRMTPKEERVPGNSLFMKFGQGSESPYAYKARLYQIFSAMNTPGSTPACSVIKVMESKFFMDEVAVFDKDKVVLQLDKNETKLINLLTGNTKLGSISTKLGDDTSPLSIGITKGGAKISVKKSDSGEIICKLDIKVNATLEEADDFTGDTNAIAPLFEDILKKQTLMLMNKLKKAQVDPLQLQLYYWASDKDYELSDKWLDTLYQKVKFQVNAKVDLSQSGTLGA